MKCRIAVLASGGGTNLEAILDHFSAIGDAVTGEVVLVGSNRAGAGALDRGRAAHIESVVFDSTSEDALKRLLTGHRVELVVLAGYLRLIPPGVIAQYRGRMINVHPGPLPRFGGAGMYGVRVHEAVLAARMTESAVTIHMVTERYDEGEHLAVWPVPVHVDDTPATLASRVLAVEHLVLPRIVDAMAATLAASRTTN